MRQRFEILYVQDWHGGGSFAIKIDFGLSKCLICFGQVQNVLVESKSFWSSSNRFGRVQGSALISLYFNFPRLWFPYTLISLDFNFPTLISLDYDFPTHRKLWGNIWYNLCYVGQNVHSLVEIGLRHLKI